MRTAPLHVGSLCNLTTANHLLPSIDFAASAHDTESKAEQTWKADWQLHQGKVLAQHVHCIV